MYCYYRLYSHILISHIVLSDTHMCVRVCLMLISNPQVSVSPHEGCRKLVLKQIPPESAQENNIPGSSTGTFYMQTLSLKPFNAHFVFECVKCSSILFCLNPCCQKFDEKSDFFFLYKWTLLSRCLKLFFSLKSSNFITMCIDVASSGSIFTVGSITF